MRTAWAKKFIRRHWIVHPAHKFGPDGSLVIQNGDHPTERHRANLQVTLGHPSEFCAVSNLGS